MMFILRRVAIAAILTVGLPALALADVAPGAGSTIIAKGVITGGTGVALNCANVGVEFHNSAGTLVAKSSSTTPGAGGCAYAVTVPAHMALTSCAGAFSKASLDSPAFAPAVAKMYVASNNHESLGTLGSAHIYSNIITVSPDGTGGQIMITSAP
jgi:hypothetical protein